MLDDIDKEKQLNREYVERFPILAPHNLYTGAVNGDYDYEFTMFDSIPEGWLKSFGWVWAQELQSIVDKMTPEQRGRFYIIDLKEKFGEFHQYFSFYTEELCDFIEKYKKLARKVCKGCGNPAEYYSTGWISPWCSECFNKLSNLDKGDKVIVEKFLKEFYDE